MSRAARLLSVGIPALLAAILLSACGPGERVMENRQWSDNFAFRITPNPSPPRAIDDIRYTVVVQDKRTGEPIENGEGRIFATSQDGVNVDDGLAKGNEVGTYYGHLLFPTTGDWAMALQFRRVGTQRLERVDWVQTVRTEAEPGT